MSTLHKEYHRIPETAKSKVAGKEIKMTISFNREGVNWATSQRVPIGYRVSIVPVEITHMDNGTGNGGKITMESIGAFTGFNDTLLEVDRQSKKRLEKAIEILHERVDGYLQWFIETENTI